MAQKLARGPTKGFESLETEEQREPPGPEMGGVSMEVILAAPCEVRGVSWQDLGAGYPGDILRGILGCILGVSWGILNGKLGCILEVLWVVSWGYHYRGRGTAPHRGIPLEFPSRLG